MKRIKENAATRRNANKTRLKNVQNSFLNIITYSPVPGKLDAVNIKLIHPKKRVNIPICHCHFMGHPQSFRNTKTNIIDRR